MDMDTQYNFKIFNPNEKLSVSIKQTDKEDIVLTAVQTGFKRESLLLSNYL